MRYVALAALPQDHSLRNRPLGLIGAQYLSDDGWRPVGRSYPIVTYTYNQLGIGWLSSAWRAPEDV
jgi:hypothetical protein